MTTPPSPSTLKDQINSQTLKILILSFASAGIYLVLWVFKNHQTIDRITGTKTADEQYIIWMAIALGLYGVFASNPEDFMIGIAFLLYVAYLVLVIVWAFRAKRAIENYAAQELGISFTLNPVLTVLFNVFYINFSINKLSTLSPAHPATGNDPA